MEEQKPISETIKEAMETKGLPMVRLQQLTDIPERYLETIFKGEFKKMPAAPYIRGYLYKISEILGLNGEELWQKYKKEAEIFSSGAQDRLPENRFAIKTISKKWLVGGIIGAVILTYLGINAGRLLGKPALTINLPIADTTLNDKPNTTISGTINPSDILKINGQEIIADKEGRFEKNYVLQPGINNFEISAKRFLGRETKVVKQIIYQPASESKN